jgi:hypothetical protein
MTATLLITLRCIVRSAAAGIAKFHRGRAGFTVTGGTRAVPVLLATRAGVQSSGFILIIGFRYFCGCWYCVFWHFVTNRIVHVR